MIYTSRYGIIMRIVTDDKLPIRLFGRTHFYIIYFTPVLLIRVFWVLSKPDCWIRKMLLPLCPELIWKMEFWISGGVRFQIFTHFLYDFTPILWIRVLFLPQLQWKYMESVSPSGGTDFMYFLYLLSPFLYLFLFIFKKWIYIFILYHPQGWDKMYI